MKSQGKGIVRQQDEVNSKATSLMVDLCGPLGHSVNAMTPQLDFCFHTHDNYSKIHRPAF